MMGPARETTRPSKRQRTAANLQENDDQIRTPRDSSPINPSVRLETHPNRSSQNADVVRPFLDEAVMGTTTASRKPPSSRRTWRVRGLPLGFGKTELAEALQHHPDLRPCSEDTVFGGVSDKSSNGVSVQTLALDLQAPWQVATVRFRNPPSQLDRLESKSQLAIEIGIPSKKTPARFEPQRELTHATVTIDEQFDGITTLFSPPSVEDHQIDVLAISGLGSHPFGSFVHKGDGHMWLTGSLPRDIPSARVMIYGYSSGLQDSASFAQLDDLAGSLQSAISRLLRTEKRKPLILIGHSLGGLLVKEALVQIAASDFQSDVLNMILGVLFFGTPNDGIDIESLIPIVNNHPNRFLLESLNNMNSQILRLQKREFSRLLSRTNFEMFCFYETELSSTAAKDPITKQYRMTGPLRCLVSVASATSCLPAGTPSDHCIAIHRPHSDLVKFASHDSDFDKVASILNQLRMSNKMGKKDYQRNPILERLPLNEEKNRELLNSLRFDQIDARFENITTAHAKTCKWLLKTSEFLGWLHSRTLSEHHGFLWIEGKPGAGKSTLMKFTLSHVRKRVKDNVVISFFFNARGHHLEKSIVGMYQSILLQLLEQRPDLQGVLGSPGLVTPQDGPRKWSVEALKDMFQQALQGLGDSSLICFIDALDECDENHIRDMISFFVQMGELTNLANIRFRVCFSSRPYPHITFPIAVKLELEAQEGHSQDITCYLDTELKIGQGEIAEQVRNELLRKASGVFLWVVLVVGILNKEHDSGHIHALRRKLRDIPGDLFKLFRSIVTRDERNKTELLLSIQWLLFARQVLTPAQLYFAIFAGVEPEGDPALNVNEITPCVMRNYIVDSSKGLADVTKSKYPTVQFIHESVRDFFLREDGLGEIWSEPGRKFEAESHEKLKQCCLSYLSHVIHSKLAIGNSLPRASSHEVAELRQSTYKVFPFSEYAVQNVLYHANAAEGGGIEQTGFLEGFQLIDWIKLDNLFQKYDARRHTLKASLLYILAEHNLGNLIRRHPTKLSCFEAEDERYGPPILAALATNSDEAVWALLNGHLESQPPASPLHGLWERYCQLANKLSAYGRGFNFSRRRGILSHLAEKGDEAITACFLLASGRLTTNSPDSSGRTPLSWAAGRGHELVADMLLAKGANTESTDRNGQTPLLWAARNGQEGVVELFLEKGANVESMDKNRQTPLLWAIKNGHLAVVKLLLGKGANAELADKDGQTPLLWAAKNGHVAIIKLFLEMDACIDLIDNNKWMLIWWAAVNECDVVVKFLLGKEADIDSKDEKVRSSLSWAARNEFKTVVAVFLEKGASTEPKVSFNWTPLLWASTNGYAAIVNLFLENGANTNSIDQVGRTPLCYAAQNGHETIVELLLEKGGRTEPEGMAGPTPLLCAIENGHETIAKLLLERGAEIESHGKFGQPPLPYAVRNGLVAVVKLLLDKGANTESTGNDGRTPLLWAAKNGHETIVKLLLEKSANVESTDKDDQTPLSVAIKNGHVTTVKLLCEYGSKSGL